MFLGVVLAGNVFEQRSNNEEMHVLKFKLDSFISLSHELTLEFLIGPLRQDSEMRLNRINAPNKGLEHHFHIRTTVGRGEGSRLDPLEERRYISFY